MKPCGRCKESLPLTAFNRAGNGRQHWCRECFREYFRARGEVHRQQARAATETRREPLRRHLLEYLREHPCTDCGESDVCVLELDHVGEKRATVGALLNSGVPLERLVAEVALCESVCANCHRRRTAARGGWSDRSRADADPGRYSLRARNVRWVLQRLARSACADCGLADPLVLEFDHIGPKNAGVMKLAWSEYSIAALEAEIARCEVRCCNCHRRRTARSARWYRAAAVNLDRPPL